MRKSVAALIIMISLPLVSATRLFPLKSVNKPSFLNVVDDRVFVTEGPKTIIYSLKTGQWLGQFGRSGQGPREFEATPFNGLLGVQATQDAIVVNCLRKLSFFTLDGKFIKEIIKRKPKTQAYPVANHFLLAEYLFDDGWMKMSLSLLSSDLKPIRELRCVNIFNMHISDIDPFGGDGSKLHFGICSDQLVVASGNEMTIALYDHNGTLQRTLSAPYQRKRVTAQDEQEYDEFMHQPPFNEAQYRNDKRRTHFPKFKPVIRNLFCDGQKVYILTYEIDRQRGALFYVFDIQTGFVRTTYQSLVSGLFELGGVITIHGGRLYKTIENDTTEEIELWAERLER